MFRYIIQFFIILTAFAGIAHAGNLKSAEVEGFVGTMEYVQANKNEFEKTQALYQDTSLDVLSRMVNDDGEVVMYRSIVKGLAKNPDEEKKMRSIVKKNGFSSLTHWAEVSDRVFVAYMGTQVSEKDRAEMRESLAAMTPEMMAMMPPNVKQKMQQATALSKAMSNVPPEDVEAIRPFVARLEAAMGE